MLNTVAFSGDTSAVDLKNLFSSDILEQLAVVRDKKIDNLIIRGLLVPEDLGETPKAIQDSIPDIFPKRTLEMLVEYFGKISEKGIENSIRFPINDNGSTNVETWHGHPQFSFSIFYCLRGDENAKTYFLSANDIMAHATEEEKQMLLDATLIKSVDSGFEFSKDMYQPSDFQRYIENLDLPDTTKALNINKEDEAFKYLLKQMIDTGEKIVYQPGDLAVYNERQTMRFSPSYMPTTEAGKERWILGVGVY